MTGPGAVPVSPITVVEPNPQRRELARQLGADEVLDPAGFSAEAVFDAAILAVGVADLVPLALRALRKNGKVSLFAGFNAGASVAIDPNLIHYHQIRVTGASESRRRDYAEAMSLVERGLVDPLPLLTHSFGLEDYEEALRIAEAGTGLKIAFDLTMGASTS
jgi:L-iditol 2-dehydrogenase